MIKGIYRVLYLIPITETFDVGKYSQAVTLQIREG